MSGVAIVKGKCHSWLSDDLSDVSYNWLIVNVKRCCGY